LVISIVVLGVVITLAVFSWRYSAKQRPVRIEGLTAIEWAGFLVEPFQLSPSPRKEMALGVLRKNRAEAERQLAPNLVERETLRAKGYARVWKTLPPVLKNRLPLPAYVTPVSTRQLAATAIAHLGPPLSPGVEAALLQGCKDPDVIVRQRSALILSSFSHGNPKIVRTINEAARDTVVSEALKRGPDFLGFNFVPLDLSQAIAAQDCMSTETKYRGLLKIEQIEGSKTPALPALLRNLTDSNDMIVNVSLRVLGTMGPAASSAVPTIKRLEMHESAGIRTKAKEALLQLSAEGN